MDNYKCSSRGTESQQDEAVLLLRMVRVVIETAVYIVEDALSFFKPDSMFSSIGLVFAFVPIEPEHI